MRIIAMTELDLVTMSDEEDESFVPLSRRQASNKQYFMTEQGKYNNYRGCLLSGIRRFGRVPKQVICEKYNIGTEDLHKAWRIYKQKVGPENVDQRKLFKMRLLVTNMF